MNKTSPFENCPIHLSQSDIFAIPLIAPYAENEIRIFRGSSGVHGYKVFEDAGLEGRVFGYQELNDFLKKLPEDERSLPFDQNSGYPHELALVSADLLEFFIIASQTCDVSGTDADQKPFASILPVVTIASILFKEKYPIEVQDPSNFNDYKTVTEYLQEKIGADFSQVIYDPYELPQAVYTAVSGWKAQNKKEKIFQSAIINLLDKIRNTNRAYIYYLPSEKEMGVPEGIVDFCRLFTLPTETLEEMKIYRVSTLATPYREHFAQKLSSYLSRIAIPTPLVPERIQ